MCDSRGRREFVGLLSGGLAGMALLRPGRANAASGGGYHAIALDGFALFDPRPIAALATQLFPDKGAELISFWRVKQFDYQWLPSPAVTRTSGQRRKAR